MFRVTGAGAELGGGLAGERPMPHVLATADRIDYWIRQHLVPCPTHTKVDPALQRRIGLTAIGQCLKGHYAAITTPMPAYLAALVEQLEAQR